MVGEYLVTFTACRSALVVQNWWPSGRVISPEVIELPIGVTGTTYLTTCRQELFVGGRVMGPEHVGPWVGRMDLNTRDRKWISLLSEQDDARATEKEIDALSYSLSGENERVIAFDNIMYPLYAWLIDSGDDGKWEMPKCIEIEAEYTYERIVSAYASERKVYLVTSGINHGVSMQFLREFNRDCSESKLLTCEVEESEWGSDRDLSEYAKYGRGQVWSQVLATEDGIVFIAAGGRGLGRFDPRTGEVVYTGDSGVAARQLVFNPDETLIAVGVEDTHQERSSRTKYGIDVYSVRDLLLVPEIEVRADVGDGILGKKYNW